MAWIPAVQFSTTSQTAAVTGVGDGRLALAIDLEGAVRGRLYLVGTPTLDRATGEVTVPDLRFSVGTRSILLRGAAWLARGAFPERIQQAVRFDAKATVEQARLLASREVDRDLGEGVRLEGRLDEAELVAVMARRDALVIRSRVGGELRLRIEAEPWVAGPTPSGTAPDRTAQ
jgi:hypothetical protein